MPHSFDIENFKRERRKLRSWANVCIFGGMVWSLVDCLTSFPTPVRGPYAMAIGLPIVVVGFYLLFLAQRLPIKEAIQLAGSVMYKGTLKVTDLVREMDVTIGTAERTLRTLEANGYARCEQDEEHGTEVYEIDVRVLDSPF